MKTHFDRMAYVTAVASLNPSEFDGGLFLQRTPRVDSREFFATEATDVAFHSYALDLTLSLALYLTRTRTLTLRLTPSLALTRYDLEHGVEVLEGRL